MEWISAYHHLPEQEREIMFIADDSRTDERLGMAIPSERIVLLKRTELEFKHLQWWFYVPHAPGFRDAKEWH